MLRHHDDIATLADRPDWTVTGRRAEYVPLPRGWRAVVHAMPAGRYHVASVDRAGTTRWTREVPTLADAVRTAERDVAARNALRAV